MLDSARIEEAKAACLLATEPTSTPSAELVSSWRRSHAALGTPANVRDVPCVAEDLLDARLLEMFRAPLQRFTETLGDTGLGLLLSDPSGRILECWSADSTAERHLESVGTLRGAVLSEETVGTNGVGTALATGHLVQVRGPEHFADFYRGAMCTGAPVRHPVTGRILGAITLSCEIAPRPELLPPLLRTVSAQLQHQVLEVERPASRRALETFVTMASSHTDPVVVLGPRGLVMQNAQASRLGPERIAEIQEVCRDISPGKDGTRLIRTPNLTLEVNSAEPGNHLVVIRSGPIPAHTGSGTRATGPARPASVLAGRSPDWLAALREVARARAERWSPVVLAGEPGTGKLSVALGTPSMPGRYPAGHSVLDSAESHVIGSRDWLRKVAAIISSDEVVCVRAAETLDRATLAGLRSVLETAATTTPLVTLSTADKREAEDLAVRLGGDRVIWIPPLRDRVADLPELWNAFARTAAPAARLTLSEAALRVLRAHRWPGNLVELRSVVQRLASAGKIGPVEVGDLPASLRSEDPALPLIEQVELRAIRQALQEAGGNRAQAAKILGISRATIYRKMKTYRLTL
ncbi:sigma-54-dependent Fis family transcriptional regulator [Amycolatopsis taiwanensis]|uniref:sigma-54-dependent Fis family transcriptional regulator n=1 Tax=Amycolatopsis taiwanensis TaxID=342230 RepID=UPI0004AEE32D|nr:helix-turn-helix domain-containing protein [Amycolatopsis taiwanensis]